MTELPQNIGTRLKSSTRSIDAVIARNIESQSHVSHVVSVRDVVYFFQQNWPVIIALSIGAIALAIVYTIVTPPAYRASATVMFDPNVGSALLRDDNWQSTETSARTDSQVEIIKSGRVAKAVVQTLSLNKDPIFVSPPSAPLLPFFKFTAEPPDNAAERAAVSLLNKLSVRRIGESTALEISIVSPNADVSAKVANAVAQAYIEVALQDKAAAAQNGANWLVKRLDYLREQAFKAALDSENFKAIGGKTAVDSRVKAAELDSIAQSYRKMYDSFLLKYFETEQLVTYPVADARLLSLASADLTDKSPKKGVIIAFAAFAGAFAGIGLALVRRSLDHTIRSPAALVSVPQMTFCGFVEHAGKLKLRPRSKSGSRRGLSSLFMLRRREREDARLSTLIEEPSERLRNNLRHIRSSILVSLPSRSSRVIGISSIENKEGKTAVAVNLAALFASSGYRTLLVDACLANPSASRILAEPSAPGLYDALRTNQPLEGFITSSPAHAFSFMPSGNITTPRNLADFLDGPATKAVFSSVSTAYDIVIIDLPALTENSDAVSLAALLDGMIVVAEFGRTRQDQYAHEVRRLVAGRSFFVGSVLNKANPINGA